MKQKWSQRLGRFIRWLCGSPFRRLPPAFGNTVPADLQVFEAQAAEARRSGLGPVATTAPMRHVKTRPARADSSLERQ